MSAAESSPASSQGSHLQEGQTSPPSLTPPSAKSLARFPCREIKVYNIIDVVKKHNFGHFTFNFKEEPFQMVAVTSVLAKNENKKFENCREKLISFSSTNGLF